MRSASHRSRNIPLTHISFDNFDEYTRRQFVAKAPQRNPYGTDEIPNKFSDFDVFTKIRVLHQLSTWTLWNAERMRGLMEEKDNEQTQWVCSRHTKQTTYTETNNMNSALKSLAGILRTAPTSYWTMTACIAAPMHRYHPLPLPNRKQRSSHAGLAAPVPVNA